MSVVYITRTKTDDNCFNRDSFYLLCYCLQSRARSFFHENYVFMFLVRNVDQRDKNIEEMCSEENVFVLKHGFCPKLVKRASSENLLSLKLFRLEPTVVC